MLLATATSSFAQDGLNIAQFFTDTYGKMNDVTIVNMNYDNPEKGAVRIYKSISVVNNRELSDKIARAVTKDGTSANNKEVSYRDGELYFGFYSMGGKRSSRRYILFLNKRPKGVEKTTLIFIEGNLDEKDVKSLIK